MSPDMRLVIDCRLCSTALLWDASSSSVFLGRPKIDSLLSCMCQVQVLCAGSCRRFALISLLPETSLSYVSIPRRGLACTSQRLAYHPVHSFMKSKEPYLAIWNAVIDLLELRCDLCAGE